MYASDQAHFSISRALDVLGFPSETLRIVPSDERFRLHASPVADAVAEDRAAGLVPFAIAAVAGSTNTGSVDLRRARRPRPTRTPVAPRRRCVRWRRRVLPRVAPRVPDLERADSVTIDPHKWFFQAYDIGALVVRRREVLLQTFHRAPSTTATRAPRTRRSTGSSTRSRAPAVPGAEALALLEAPGDVGVRPADRAQRRPRRVPRCAVPRGRRLRGRPGRARALGRLLPSPARRARGEALDAYQDRLQLGLEASGEAWVSTTKIRGATYLRAGIVNYLSSETDVDRMLEALRRLSVRAAAAAPRT